jgi:hypothetical protein
VAPFAGVVEQVRDGSLDPVSLAANQGRLELGPDGQRRRTPAQPVDRVGGDRVEPHFPGLGVGPRAAGELDDVADERGELVELLDHVRAQRLAVGLGEAVLVAHQLEVCADRCDRGAQLVGSVGDELALRAHRAFKRVERLVERAGETGELVAADDLQALVLDPLRSGGDRLRLAGEARDRSQRGPCNQDAEQRRQRDPARGDRDQQRQLAGEGVVDVGERQRDRERAFVADARHQHPDVGARHRHVGQVPPLTVTGELLDRRGGRDPIALAGRHRRVSTAIEQREDPGCGAERGAVEAVEPESFVADAWALLRVVSADRRRTGAGGLLRAAGLPRAALGRGTVRSPVAGPWRDMSRLPRERVQRAVDLASQLRTRAGVGRDGDGDDRKRHGHARRQAHPRPQAHRTSLGSRSTYPTPRIVRISGGAPASSSLRRR